MFRTRFFIFFGLCIALTLAAAWMPQLLTAAKVMLIVLAALTGIDFVAVLTACRQLKAKRQVNDYLSMGQPNMVEVQLYARHPNALQRWFLIEAEDTVPQSFKVIGDKTLSGLGIARYNVVPSSRGRYEFGVLRCLVSSRWLRLVRWSRFLDLPQVVNVYPTFKHLDKLEVMANVNSKLGAKRMRRAGNSTDFNQIRAYVPGDDVRTINWKASARATDLMVNTYTEERSKPIISILCGGPSMLTTSDGVSLLDRATCAAIALADSSIRHYDEAGLICATHRGVVYYLKPEKSNSTLPAMLDATYSFGLPPIETEIELIKDDDVMHEEVDPLTINKLRERMDACQADTDYEALADFVQKKITRRSMLLLFANFENITVAKQALPALLRMGQRNTLVLVLFKNDSVTKTVHPQGQEKLSSKLADQRLRAVCAHYEEQQQLLASYLSQNHVRVIFTTPDQLTTSVLGTYLDLKNQGIV